MGAQTKPATFDRTRQNRRAMLAKVHIAKKQLALDEDDYRQILFDVTGYDSAGDCEDAALKRVLKRLEALGFKPLPKRGASQPARSPMAKKARALWISLHHLGEVRNASEKALEAFGKRQLGCERMAWANQREAYKLIEALKAMAERAGWRQTNAHGAALSPRELNEGLCEAILCKLKNAGEVPEHWTLNDAAFRLCGTEPGAAGPMRGEDYADLAAKLGKVLRETGGETC